MSVRAPEPSWQSHPNADREAYQLLFEHVGDMVCTLDLEGRFTAVNGAGERLTGYPADELVRKLAIELIAPERRDEAVRQFQDRLAGDSERPPDESVLVTRDGRRVPIEVTSTLFWLDGRAAGVLGLVDDVSERQRAQNAVRRSEAWFRALLDAAPDGIVITNSDGRIVLVNAQTEQLFGYARDELLGQQVELLLPDAVRAAHREHRTEYLADPRVRQMGAGLELAGRRRDGSELPVDVSLSPLQTDEGTLVVAAVRDVTESRRAEEERDRLRDELHHAQKLEAIGRLAGGVAHDFNNMLTAIKGYSELLLDGLDDASPLRAEAEQIRRAADQASALPRQLLAFGRKQPSEPKLVDLHHALSAASDLLGRLAGESIELVTIPAARSALVRADPSQVEQMLLNLVVNARDAMPGGGTLTIATRNVDLTDEVAVGSNAPAGRYVVVSVADTGQGMDAETKARVFEPFFTTKAPGTGSGLGLATVYGIVGAARRLHSRRQRSARGLDLRHLPPMCGDRTRPRGRARRRAE